MARIIATIVNSDIPADAHRFGMAFGTVDCGIAFRDQESRMCVFTSEDAVREALAFLVPFMSLDVLDRMEGHGLPLTLCLMHMPRERWEQYVKEKDGKYVEFNSFEDFKNAIEDVEGTDWEGIIMKRLPTCESN